MAYRNRRRHVDPASRTLHRALQRRPLRGRFRRHRGEPRQSPDSPGRRRLRRCIGCAQRRLRPHGWRCHFHTTPHGYWRLPAAGVGRISLALARTAPSAADTPVRYWRDDFIGVELVRQVAGPCRSRFHYYKRIAGANYSATDIAPRPAGGAVQRLVGRDSNAASWLTPRLLTSTVQ